MTPTEWHEGPPRYFVPVIKSAKVFPQQCIGGPIGYEEVAADELPDGPIVIEEPTR